MSGRSDKVKRRQETRDQQTQKSGITRRRVLAGLGIGLPLLGLAGYGIYSSKSKPTLLESPDDQPVNKPTQPTLEELITPYAEIKKTINPEGTGNLYLIAQEHMPQSTVQENTPNETLAYVQREIYFLLSTLAHQRGLSLVVGEGLGKNELTLSVQNKGFTHEQWLEHRMHMNSPDFALKFFQKNPYELGYTVLELFYPELIKTFGTDDKEQMEELNALRQQLHHLELSFFPPGTQRTPELVEHYNLMRHTITMERTRLNDERSLLYLDTALTLSSSLQKENVALVIGAYHVHLMAERYEGEKTLHLLKPKSLPERLYNITTLH